MYLSELIKELESQLEQGDCQVWVKDKLGRSRELTGTVERMPTYLGEAVAIISDYFE